MLILPVAGKNSPKRPPYMTLGLIIVNTIIYFFFQINDHRIYLESMTYYHDSGLLKIEVSAYRAYLEHNGETVVKEGQRKDIPSEMLVRRMLRDHQFLALLRADRIIRPDMVHFTDWRQKRDIFETKRSRAVSHRFGYSPVKKNVAGLFGHMFLHGSIMHLVGNMTFLYFVGALLELVIGPACILAGYLVTGICAGYLFGLAHPLAAGPLIGASGAVSGLMGGYTVIYKLRKVRVFYSLGFYFNYAKVPAIILLPLWLGKEIFQLYHNPDGQVAYMAHIGGIISGGLLAALYLSCKKDAVSKVFKKDDQKKAIGLHLRRGLENMAKLDLEEARRDMLAVLDIQPGHREALRHLFNIDKSDPQSERFHASSAALLDSLNPHEENLFMEIFEQYKRLAPKPRAAKRFMPRLIRIYLNRGEYRQAEAYLAALIKKDVHQPTIPGLLMRLAEGYASEGRRNRVRSCLAILTKHFGTSHEGMRARKMLSSAFQDRQS